MDRAIEGFVAVTSLIIGMSHIVRARDWCEFFRQLHALGHTEAFINGGLNLFTGAFIVAGHPVWTGPGIVITVFGWMLIAKTANCFLLPQNALRPMERGSQSPRNFVIAGVVTLSIGGWSLFSL
jgi:hypothetical protein